MDPTIRESIRRYQFQEINGDAVNTQRIICAKELNFNEIINRVTTLFQGVQANSHTLSINIHGSNINLVSNENLNIALTYLKPQDVRIISVKLNSSISGENGAPIKLITGRSAELNILISGRSATYNRLIHSDQIDAFSKFISDICVAQNQSSSNLDEITVPQKPIRFPTDNDLFYWAKQTGILSKITDITDTNLLEHQKSSIMTGNLWPKVKEIYQLCVANWELKQLNRIQATTATSTPAPNPPPAPTAAPAQKPTHSRANRAVENRTETVQRKGTDQRKKSSPKVLNETTVPQKPVRFPTDNDLFYWAKQTGILSIITGITDTNLLEHQKSSIMTGNLWPKVKEIYQLCVANWELKQSNRIQATTATSTPAPNPPPAPTAAPAQKPTHYRANRAVENRTETVRRKGPYQRKKSSPKVLTIREQVEQLFKDGPFSNFGSKKS